MRNIINRRAARKNSGGFTLTELLVLVAVGAILTGLFLPQLSQTRSQLLRDACAANLKHWGLVFEMYSQDYKGSLFELSDWDNTVYTGNDGNVNTPNPYVKYFGGTNNTATLRNMRICPYVAATVSQSQIVNVGLFSYSMAFPTVRAGGGAYENLRAPLNGNQSFIWPNLSAIPYPAQYLLMMDGSGHNVLCGSLTTTVNNIPNGDTTRPIDRHGGGVNCLFADQHVAYILYQAITNQDAVPCNTGNPWFMMN